jgi:hypothetical protein
METDKRFQVLADEDLVRDLDHALGENTVFVAVNPTPCRKVRQNRRGAGNRGNGSSG